jgi:hypothetical protein
VKGSRLRGYVGGGVEGMTIGTASSCGEDGGVEESQGCGGVLEIACGIAVVISDVGVPWISGLELAGTVCSLYALLICPWSMSATRTTN